MSDINTVNVVDVQGDVRLARSAGGDTSWGSITGNINNQTDLIEKFGDYALESSLSAVATSGSYNDLSNKPTIPTVPTNISAFVNDSGYITSVPVDSVNGKTGTVVLSASDVGALASNTTYVSSVNGSSGAVTISVPTKTSDLQNDSGFLTSAVTTFNGQSGAVTYSAPVSSVNGQTGAVTGLQTTSNLVTSVSSASTDSQYPSAKCLYDMVGNIETLLASI